jgi:hypothetical protein
MLVQLVQGLYQHKYLKVSFIFRLHIFEFSHDTIQEPNTFKLEAETYREVNTLYLMLNKILHLFII